MPGQALTEFLKRDVDGLDPKAVERWLAEGGHPAPTAPPAGNSLGNLCASVPIVMGERGELRQRRHCPRPGLGDGLRVGEGLVANS